MIDNTYRVINNVKLTLLVKKSQNIFDIHHITFITAHYINSTILQQCWLFSELSSNKIACHCQILNTNSEIILKEVLFLRNLKNYIYFLQNKKWHLDMHTGMSTGWKGMRICLPFKIWSSTFINKLKSSSTSGSAIEFLIWNEKNSQNVSI